MKRINVRTEERWRWLGAREYKEMATILFQISMLPFKTYDRTTGWCIVSKGAAVKVKSYWEVINYFDKTSVRENRLQNQTATSQLTQAWNNIFSSPREKICLYLLRFERFQSETSAKPPTYTYGHGGDRSAMLNPSLGMSLCIYLKRL